MRCDCEYMVSVAKLRSPLSSVLGLLPLQEGGGLGACDPTEPLLSG